jgi:hypothetical protein
MMRAALLTLMAAVAAYPDTVTTTDHLSLNGTLTKMSDRTVTLEAKFSAGPKTLQIPMGMIDSIEFNSIAFNPGAPPKTFGLGPGTGPAPKQTPAQAAEKDVVVLRGNQRKACKLVSVDEAVVRCEGKGNEYSRKIVLRVLIGAGR